MSFWFTIVIILIIIASAMVILIRIEGRKKSKGVEEGEFSADDFEILE